MSPFDSASRASRALVPCCVLAALVTVMLAARAAFDPGRAFGYAPWPGVAIVAVLVGARSMLQPIPPPSRFRHPELGSSPVALVAFAAAVAYLPSLSLPFLDAEDWYHLILVRHAERFGIGAALADAWVYLRGHPGMWIRSLHLVVWYLEDRLFSGWAPGYRLVAIAFHVTTAFGVMRLARLLDLPRGATLLSGVVFAVHPTARDLVRDPTGLPELTLGAGFTAALLLWVPMLEGSPAKPSLMRRALAYALLPLLIVTRDQALLLPLVLVAIGAARALDRQSETEGLPKRVPWGRIVRGAAPTALVTLSQATLAVSELILDPTSGRPQPGHPMGEFGQFAEGVTFRQIGGALFRDLPRNLLFPVWDKDSEAHLAPWIAALAGLWLLSGLGAGRRHRAALLSALALIVAPTLLAFPFTTAEGPDNAHLFYLSLIGISLAAGAWWANIEIPWVRRLAFSGLAAAIATALTFHVTRLSTERAEGERIESAQRWIDSLERARPEGRSVILVGGTEPGTDRWKNVVLSAHARSGTWHQRYALMRQVGLIDRRAAVTGHAAVLGFSTRDGEPSRLRSDPRSSLEGLEDAPSRPSVCRSWDLSRDEKGLCEIDRPTRFESLREVLLTM